MMALVNGGFPRDKIVVGIPAYGRSYMLSDQSKSGLGESITGNGPDDGVLPYYKVSKCEN